MGDLPTFCMSPPSPYDCWTGHQVINRSDTRHWPSSSPNYLNIISMCTFLNNVDMSVYFFFWKLLFAYWYFYFDFEFPRTVVNPALAPGITLEIRPTSLFGQNLDDLIWIPPKMCTTILWQMRLIACRWRWLMKISDCRDE